MRSVLGNERTPYLMLALLLGNALLGQVDHEEDDPILRPAGERIGVQHLFLEVATVEAPIAAREDRQDRPAGSFRGGQGVVVAGQPAVGGPADARPADEGDRPCQETGNPQKLNRNPTAWQSRRHFPSLKP
jgi:hypothetical protein